MASALQTAYNDTPAGAFPGQLRNGPQQKESVRNAEGSASIPFGFPVVYKTASPLTDRDVLLPSATTDKLRGLLFRSDGYSRAWTDDTGTNGALDSVGVRAGQEMDIAVQGWVWAKCHTGCAPGDRLFVCAVTGGATYTTIGQLGNVAEATKTIDASTKGEWKSTAVADGFAWLSIDCRAK